MTATRVTGDERCTVMQTKEGDEWRTVQEMAHRRRAELPEKGDR